MSTSVEQTIRPVDEPEAGPVVRIDGLEAEFALPGGSFHAVKRVDLDIHPGETLVILGESGSGKSVTIRAVLALLAANETVRGEIRYAGRDLLTSSQSELRKVRGSQIAMVPQDPSYALDPLRNVGSQIAETMKVHGVARDRATLREKVDALLLQVGITDTKRVAKARPHELSGGMRQRVAIALAVACNPKVLLADEPTSALDMTTQAQVLELFRELQAASGMALVMVTHDIAVAAYTAHRIVVMYAGRVVESGTADQVLNGPSHPYTRSLLAAQPRPDVPRGQLAAIPGSAPGPGEQLEIGCDFAPRCALAQDSCRTETPHLAVAGAGGHVARCPITIPLTPAPIGDTDV